MSWLRNREIKTEPYPAPEPPRYLIVASVDSSGSPGWKLLERYYEYIPFGYSIKPMANYRLLANNPSRQVMEDAKKHLEGTPCPSRQVIADVEKRLEGTP